MFFPSCVACCSLVAFCVYFCFMFCLFSLKDMFWKILLMSGLLFLKVSFRNHFRERTFVFFLSGNSGCGLLFFSGVLPMFYFMFCLFAPGVFSKNSLDVRPSLLFLGSLFGIHFRERTFVFFCLVVACFWWCLHIFLLYVLSFRSRTRFGKILLMSGLLFVV